MQIEGITTTKLNEQEFPILMETKPKAYAYAHPGACGRSDTMLILTEDHKIYYIEDVSKKNDTLKSCFYNFWHHQKFVEFYMGLGNFLYVLPEDENFLKEKTKNERPSYLYANWVTLLLQKDEEEKNSHSR